MSGQASTSGNPAFDPTAPVVQAQTLPPRAYHDQALFAEECEKLFRKEWLCLGRADQFAAPGRYATFEIAGEPVLLIADSGGAVRAFSNVCRHRGAILMQGSGEASRLVCPYHAWTYATDGALMAAPFMERTPGFDARQCRLPEFRVEIWQGFVFVNLDPDAAPLAPRLKGLEHYMAPYHYERFHVGYAAGEVWQANWKLLVENGSESYHLFKAHRTTIETLRPTKDQEFVASGPGYHVHIMNAGPTMPTPLTPHAPDLTERQRRQALVIAIYPSTVFILTATDGGWFTVLPQSVDVSQVSYGSVGAVKLPDGAEGEAIRARMKEFGDIINGEDRPVVESLHKGTASRLCATSAMSYLEVPVYEFHSYLRSKLTASVLGN